MLLSLLWFSVLIFLPGFVLLGLFKLKNIHWLEGVLYIIGLSLAFDIVIGLAINFGLPLLGFINPISSFPVTLVWAIITIVFAVLIFKYHDRLIQPYYFKFSWWGLAPLLIYLVSVFFIYQMTLPTANLMGSDIHMEYYYAKQTLLNGYWDVSSPSPVNTCLPITILIPIVSILTKIDIMTIFKVVQPLVFALLPLVLYRIYRLQFGQTVAILATVFFITLPTFTMDMVQLIRQQYAMLFFALVALILVDRRFGLYVKSILGVLFGIGVIASHYGLGMGFVGYILLATTIVVLVKVKWVQIAWQWVTRQKDKLPSDFLPPQYRIWIPLGILCVTCVGFLLFYFTKSGAGINMGSALGVPYGIAKATVLGLNYTSGQREVLLQTAIGLDFMNASGLGKVWRILQYLVELCLIIGIVRLVLRPSSFSKIKVSYFAFIIASAVFLVGLYILPTISYGMGATRILGIAMMFVAPMFVYGVGIIARWVVKLSRLINHKIKWKQYFVTLAFGCLVLPYFVFNNGIVFEIVKSDEVSRVDIPFSIGWSSYRLDMTSRFTQEDLDAMKWVKDKISVEYPLYVDGHSDKLATQNFYYYSGEVQMICGEPKGYVFLRKWNVDYQTLTFGSGYACRESTSWAGYECGGYKPMLYVLENGVTVFDNGAKIIFVDGEK